MATTELQRWEETATDAVLAEVDAGQLSLAGLEDRARSYETSSKATNTWRAYRSDLRHFGAWCTRRGLTARPAEPDTVRLYVVDHAGRLAVSTLRRRLSAIAEAHQAAQLPNPTASPVVRFAGEGMRRPRHRTPGEGSSGHRGRGGHGHAAGLDAGRHPGPGAAAARLRLRPAPLGAGGPRRR